MSELFGPEDFPRTHKIYTDQLEVNRELARDLKRERVRARALRGALIAEWGGSHAERCTNLHHEPGDVCRCEPPAALGVDDPLAFWNDFLDNACRGGTGTKG